MKLSMDQFALSSPDAMQYAIPFYFQAAVEKTLYWKWIPTILLFLGVANNIKGLLSAFVSSAQRDRKLFDLAVAALFFANVYLGMTRGVPFERQVGLLLLDMPEDPASNEGLHLALINLYNYHLISAVILVAMMSLQYFIKQTLLPCDSHTPAAPSVDHTKKPKKTGKKKQQ